MAVRIAAVKERWPGNCDLFDDESERPIVCAKVGANSQRLRSQRPLEDGGGRTGCRTARPDQEAAEGEPLSMTRPPPPASVQAANSWILKRAAGPC